MTDDAQDTPTGTDPDAKYEQPGYEDKSFGQAVDQDQELVEELVEETDGDIEEAERRFEQESAGAPVLAEQGVNPFDPDGELDPAADTDPSGRGLTVGPVSSAFVVPAPTAARTDPPTEDRVLDAWDGGRTHS